MNEIYCRCDNDEGVLPWRAGRIALEASPEVCPKLKSSLNDAGVRMRGRSI